MGFEAAYTTVVKPVQLIPVGRQYPNRVYLIGLVAVFVSTTVLSSV